MTGGDSGPSDRHERVSLVSCEFVKVSYLVLGVQAHLPCSPGGPREMTGPPGRGPLPGSAFR